MMEENEQTPAENNSMGELKLNDEIQNYLYITAKWGKMLAIIGFVFIGFLIIVGFSFGAIFSFLGRINPGLEQFPASIGLIYAAMGILYFFPTLYLYQFSNSIKDAVQMNNEEQLTYAFEKLKSFFKFWGVFMLIIIIFYILIIALAVMQGISAWNQMS